MPMDAAEYAARHRAMHARERARRVRLAEELRAAEDCRR